MIDTLAFSAPCILGMLHLMSTPVFFTRTRGYLHFLVFYVLYTIGIVALDFLAASLPYYLYPAEAHTGGEGGEGILVLLFFPIYFTAPIVILARTVYHLVQLGRKR